MPELPEVETIKNDLSKKILNKKIVSAQVRKARIVKSGVKGFIATLTGNKIIKLNRRGKLLIVSLQKGGERLLIIIAMPTAIKVIL